MYMTMPKWFEEYLNSLKDDQASELMQWFNEEGYAAEEVVERLSLGGNTTP